MKQKTKESIEWIKSVLNDCKINTNNCCSLSDEEKVQRYANIENAINFLNSLPDIESHLRRGGYIQDSEGIPCCDGDSIVNESILDGKEEKGILYWSKNDFRFYFKKADGVLNHLSINFRKVEK